MTPKYHATKSPSTGTGVFPEWMVNYTQTATVSQRVSSNYDLMRHQVFGSNIWKRGLDILMSAIALTVFFPVMVIFGVLVKATSKGPVFISQERIGLNRRVREPGDRRRRPTPGPLRNGDRRQVVSFGKPFSMYKFRSMKVNAEPDNKPKWALKNDPRITTVGRIMRKARIDEIPQFVNVLKGDMSIVGPRPERAYFIHELDEKLPAFKTRLRTKPGITGLAQVTLGYTNTVEGLSKKLSFDLKYINELSFRNDVKILLRTIPVVVTGKGAY